MTIKLKKDPSRILRISSRAICLTSTSKVCSTLWETLYCTVGINTRRRLFTFGKMRKGLKQDKEACAVDLTFVKKLWPRGGEFASACKAERERPGGRGWVLRDECDFSQAEKEVEGRALMAEEIENRQLLFGAGREVGTSGLRSCD